MKITLFFNYGNNLGRLYKSLVLLPLFLLLVSGNAWGQISIGSVTTAYTQNFDKLGIAQVTGTSGNLNNKDTALNGWYFLEDGGDTTMALGDGSSNSGNSYNFGVTNNTDRTLGGLRSGSNIPYLGFYFKNTTGGTITSIKISYTGKTWRVGSANRSDRLQFQYSTTATALSTTAWTSVTSLDYANPGQAMGSGSVQHSSVITYTITGLSIANNSTFFMKWVDYDATGADDGMGIDNFSMVLNPVSLTYSGNSSTSGAVPSDSNSPYVQGSTATVLGNTGSLDKTGYTFSGWNTQADGSGSNYNAGNTFVISSNTTLYAKWVPQNTAPTATNVSFSGALTVGTELTGSYTYSDTENDPQGTSTYKWYRADDASGTNSVAISGANTNKYTLASGDLGKYIRFSVVPVAQTGTLTGIETFSGWQGTVTSTSPYITTSGTLSAVNTIYGTASSNVSFTISAANLTNNLIITPPSGFEISTSNISGFTTASLDLGNGTQANTPIYVRLSKTTNIGSYSGNINLASGSTTAAIATASSTVSPKALTITGLTASNKDYDGNASVVVTGTPAYNGLENADSFPVTGAVTWAFQNKTAGVNKNLVRTGDYNAPSTNYTVTQPVLQATIIKKDIAITSITAADKVYDGSNVVTFSGISSTGVISGDAVTFTATGTFSDANAGDDKTVTVSAIGLSGNDSGNYDVPVMPTGLTASISKANQVISFDAIPDLNVGASIDLNSYVIKTSNLPLTFVSSTPAIASLTGDVLMGNNIGTTTITASQAGNNNYNAAESIQGQVNVVEQPVAFAQWDFTGYGGQNQTAAVTLLAQTIHTGIDAGSANLVRGTGAAQSDADNSFRTTGFKNDGIAVSNTDYFQTTFTSSQNIMSLKEIRAQVAGTASFVANPGVTTQFAYSLNGTTFTLINSPAILIGSAPFANVDLSGIAGLQNIPAGTTVTFRFYASGQTTTGGFGFKSPSQGSYGLEFYGNVKPSTITWDGSAWTNYNGPDEYQNALINGSYTENKGFETKNLTISSAGSLTIATDKDVIVHGSITLPADNKITLESDANLVQKGGGVDTNPNPNNYSITVKRNATMPKMGYTFWSSPVSGQNLYSFSDGYNQANGGTGNGTPWNRFYVYNEATDYFVTKIPDEIELNDESAFETGRGYAIRGMNKFDSNPANEFLFTGKMNNGVLYSQALNNSCTVENGCEKGYNMVGNPYPSSINFEALYAANSGKIYGTAYFWTNANAATQQAGSDYTGNNYAIYNLSGGTGPVDPDPTVPDDYSGIPNGIIKVGQGFIIKAKVAGKGESLEFNNDMRVGYDAGAIFYNAKKADRDRFWLTLTSPANVANTILVAYVPEATNDFEINYDGELFVIGSDSFYSILGSRKLAIQGKADFTSEDKVTLGNVYSKDGEYKISVKDKEGIFKTSQNIYLKDKVLNKVVNLTQGDYVFQGVKGTDATRFEIVYKEGAVLGNDSVTKSDFSIYKDGNDYVVTSSKKLGRVDVYDTTGRLVRSLSTNETMARIDVSAFSNGVYILKVENSGDVKTKKIIK